MAIPDIVTLHIGDLAPIELPIDAHLRASIEDVMREHNVSWENALHAIFSVGAREMTGKDFLNAISDGRLERE